MSIARLSEKGQLTIPAEYRRDFKLERESTLLIVQVGAALILVPYDEALATVTARLEAAMHGRHLSVDDLTDAAAGARTEIVAQEFGDLLTADEATG